jgi:hypothetical protein
MKIIVFNNYNKLISKKIIEDDESQYLRKNAIKGNNSELKKKIY